MGTWGAEIYSNDVSEEIRDAYIGYLEDGIESEDAMHLIFKEYEDYIKDENDIFDVWFALADTQSDVGRLHPKVKEFALALIEDGKDPERWIISGNPQGAKERRKVLEQLKAKLLGPQPQEKVMKPREVFRCPWKIGDIFAYRLESEAAKNAGLFGRYLIIHKVKETQWQHGSILPMVLLRMSEAERLPSVEEAILLEKVKSLGTGIKIHKDVTVLESDSVHTMPTKLIFLGNSKNGIEEFESIDAEEMEYGYQIWKTLEDNVIRDYIVFNQDKRPSVVQPPPGWYASKMAEFEEKMRTEAKEKAKKRRAKKGERTGLDILLDTYRYPYTALISPEDFQIAKEQGFMFDYPKSYTHEEAIEKEKELVSRISPDEVANAFLYSLSTRKLEYRSALGSFYYLRSIPEHTAAYRYKTCEYCGFCMFEENPNERGKIRGLNVLNYSRYKFGGSGQDKLHYAIFYLEMFEKMPKVSPKREDVIILKDILSLASELAPSQKMSPYLKLITSKKIIKSNHSELRVMLDILGICDVFNSKDAKGYFNHFTKSAFDRDPIEHTNDFMYPTNRWHASDGINWDAVKYVFKDALQRFEDIDVGPRD